MKIPSEFDPIRPFEPEELPAVYDRILADKQFQMVLAYLYPDVPAEAIAKKMHACKTNLDFQKTFCYPFLQRLVTELSLGCSMQSISIHANAIRLSATIVTLCSTLPSSINYSLTLVLIPHVRLQSVTTSSHRIGYVIWFVSTSRLPLSAPFIQ